MAATRLVFATLAVSRVVAELVEVSEKHQNLNHWKRLASPEPYVDHEVVFAVRQANLDKLHSALHEVSTPGHPRYGKHLSFDDVGKLTNTESTGKRVLQWIKSNIHEARVTKTSPRSEYIRVKASVASLERALHTSFHYYKSEKTGKIALRAHRYYVPHDMTSDIAAIFRTTDFPPLLRSPPRTKEKRALNEQAGASNYITPSVLNSFYRITSNTGSSDVSQAVFETSDQTYSPEDLATFQSTFNLNTETVNTDVGGHSSNVLCEIDANDCTEANLDVQYMMAVSQKTPMTFYYESNEDDPFVAFVEAVAAESSPALVNSISYGSIESEISSSTMESFNTEAMKLGTMGVSIFVSSGDDGVANYGVTSTSQCAYNPSYPATSPYVTAVGATYASSWATPGQGEVVCQSNLDNAVITSGGGFSATFSAPSWQTSAIKGYFANVATQPVSGYATGGRGYPDVALSGFGYEVVIGGSTYTVCGTSCSAPSVAGMVSLVNAVRKEAGASPLGFLNPAIYQNYSSIFNDITSGENQCTADNAVCCSEGFYAAKGWDPTTGFGSVDYTKLKTAFTSDLDSASVRNAELRLATKASKKVVV